MMSLVEGVISRAKNSIYDVLILKTWVKLDFFHQTVKVEIFSSEMADAQNLENTDLEPLANGSDQSN